MLLPHVPVQGPLHLIAPATQPALELLVLWFPVRILGTGWSVGLQTFQVEVGLLLAVRAYEGFALVDRLVLIQLRLLQELPWTVRALVPPSCGVMAQLMLL